MRSNIFKSILVHSGLAASVLLAASSTALAASSVVNLTAGPSTATLPDGSTVPMWGYSCTGAAPTAASCAALNGAATSAAWSPVIITVPAGNSLQINLTNSLKFATGSGATASSNNIPTSLTIVGQFGGGLGTPTNVASPAHAGLGVTWPVPGGPNTGTADPASPTFTPPPQLPRVQSFATEVKAGATTSLNWKALTPGTYLIESGTHPSIQAPMGLYGVLVVTSAPTTTSAGIAYPQVAAKTANSTTALPTVNYAGEVAMVMGEIDPVQNAAVDAAVRTPGFNELMVWSGQPGGCTDSTSPTYMQCYPPAVNYTPLYYLINGVAFDKTNSTKSLFPVSVGTSTNPVTGSNSVLVRLVNAGLKMHVPAIVGAQTGAPTGTGNVAPSGFSIIAEDGHRQPGIPHVQSEVFMAAGKVFDVVVNAPTGSTALPIYDRELSLSGNAISRDAGMLAYIGVNGLGLPAAAGLSSALAVADTYNSIIPCAATATSCQSFTVSDPSIGVIANDTNVYGVKVTTAPMGGSLVLNANGTFTYTPNPGTSSDSFSYCANGGTSACATVTLGGATVESAAGITVVNQTYNANVAGYISINTPGVLSGAKDGAGFALTVPPSRISGISPGLAVTMAADGGFIAQLTSPNIAATQGSFTYQAQNAQGTLSTPATVTINFPAPTGLQVTVLDGYSHQPLAAPQDYRWIIEEDTTYFVDPACTTNPPSGNCPGSSSFLAPGQTANVLPTFGTNFHTSHMPFVAQGCTGPVSCEGGQTVLGAPAICDLGNGVCRPDTSTNAQGRVPTLPSQVALDPSKRYYISILPGDAAAPFMAAYSGVPCGQPGADPSSCTSGHGMGGAPIAAACKQASQGLPCTGTFAPVTIVTQPSPYQPAKLSVFVFEDDFPLNGEQDAGGGVDVLAPNEPGLGGFQIHLWDAMGGNGDFTGQMTYDMFNQPLTNSLDGTIDPVSGLDACPITRQGLITSGRNAGKPSGNGGITGMIVTCPKYEGDGAGKILSPLAGQAVVANLMPGRFGVIATPGADRIARGEEWLQTNTLDGQKAHDSFVRIGEPSYFQEYGPAGYHDTIGFANPAIINARKPGVCAGTDAFLQLPGGTQCNNTITGHVTTERMSRTPDERLYGSGTHDSFYWTQCYVSFGDPDGEDFAFTKCDDKGNFKLTGLPPGSWRVTVFDQWNDMLVDGLSSPVLVPNQGTGTTVDMGEIATNQWQANVYTRSFADDEESGVSNVNKPGISLVNTTVRYRDGSLANNLSTDLSGTANFNEEFPLFNWYVVETDVTRYKNTGTHTVYDAGGPADGTTACGNSTNGYPNCGGSTIGKYLANTYDPFPLPSDLSVPGAVYCTSADCSGQSVQGGPVPSSTSNHSTGRIDNPWLGGTEGWQGFSGQNNFVEFGKKPYEVGENGGIRGHVVYASTRPFDDPQNLVQTQWEPLVPHVTINLYQETVASDGTKTLTLADTTQTSSFDDWAQGFRSDGKPNMSCPGQSTADLFYFTLFGQQNLLNLYQAQHGGQPAPLLPYNSQYKCYDGMHNWNQLQPAPYDGMYKFPSVTALDPVSGKPSATNCKVCIADPASDLYAGTKMLPPGKYVVEVVVPPGYELVKEEDKNILIGDNYIAPVTQEFGGLGDIFIMPDQASVGAAYNANNAQNATQSLGAVPNNGIVPGFVPEPTWPCVGEARTVPDYISLFPQTQQVSPFAGATRNLCDRKEVTLADQTGATAKFYVYTSTHIAAKFTGVITDDFTSEFDPFAPQFGEKFSPPNMPIAIKDWTGTEVGRVYSDQWGTYNGMVYSTWEVNPPNPTGYSPGMMVYCMNDPGTGASPDPLFNPAYSQFCYELPFMPGQTQYLDTPVVPTSAFAGAGYNNPDCAYPSATPAIKEVDGDVTGPWVASAGKTLTITALGDATVNNYGYSGPGASANPTGTNAKAGAWNQKTITRHYGFGASAGTVTIGGITATVGTWSDSSITVAVPTGVPNCAIQQQSIYGGSTAQCGELSITTSTGQSSIDTVTVTIGGKKPTVLPLNAWSTSPMSPSGLGAIQQAINTAQPGDMIIVPPGTYQEMLLMWKPIRLQGVGAASSVLNANTQPAGKLDPWRYTVNCLFGLALNGSPISATNAYDKSGVWKCGSDAGWVGFSGTDSRNVNIRQPQVDRLPLEGIVGWDTTTNGNLAQLLQEPTLMGAYEGAAITVLSKGVNSNNAAGYYGSGSEAAFPTGTTVLTASNCTATSHGTSTNPYPSNFWCNPSSIDGLSVTDSSQGGGGIFVHAWGHNLQIANDRVYNNIGTLSGGINIGQGESPDAYLAGQTSDTDPGSCQTSLVTNKQLPYCFDLNVNVHHNAVMQNTSIGDELFSGTPAGAGGVTFCTGADYYKFNYNWICGNLSTGDGGGLSHLGFIYNGDIEHNQILFNQSTNPTIATNGGGIVVMGAAPDGFTASGVECGSTVADADCAPGLPDGTGPNLVINANLLMGNAAESGSGGGIRLQSVNGTEVSLFPKNPAAWNSVSITNNIIANNVAGWDGAGVSLQDALVVNFVNNTVMSNDSTASSGVLFNTLGAPLASAPGATNQTTSTTTSAPQPSGLVTMPNSSNLTATFAGLTLTCPANTPTSTNVSSCVNISVPYMANDVFWQNRSYYIGVGALSSAYQQNVVTLYNSFGTTTAPSQTATGSCVAGSSYWDIGVRGDKGPGAGGSGFSISPSYSVLTNTGATAESKDASNFYGVNPTVVSQYCNGARTPPEAGGNAGWQVPPGISDATVPNPIFNLTPTATVDEGNNWVNISWGPLTLVNPASSTSTSSVLLGNYAPAAGSPVIDKIPTTAPSYNSAPTKDFFGNPRPDASGSAIDVGAVEFQGGGGGSGGGSVTVSASVPNIALPRGTPSGVGTVTLTNTSTTATATVSVSGVTVSGGSVITYFFNKVLFPATADGCTGKTLNPGASCTVQVRFTNVTSPRNGATRTGTITFTDNATGSPQAFQLTGTAN